MTSSGGRPSCIQIELVAALALDAVSAEERPAIEAHVASCRACQEELEALRPVVASLASWPTDILRPSPSLWNRLAADIAAAEGKTPISTAAPSCDEPEWEEVAAGISCKLLSTDLVHDRVSMLVRLAPGAAYPPHVHVGVEELHLLDGELWIDDRRLLPGDYNRAEADSADRRVWSETGCTCVLVTSTRDRLTG